MRVKTTPSLEYNCQAEQAKQRNLHEAQGARNILTTSAARKPSTALLQNFQGMLDLFI